jgi:hypothetical protein
MLLNLRDILQNIDATRPVTITLTLPPPPTSPPPATTDSGLTIQQFLDEYNSDEDSDMDTTRSQGEHNIHNIENGRCLEALSIHDTRYRSSQY